MGISYGFSIMILIFLNFQFSSFTTCIFSSASSYHRLPFCLLSISLSECKAVEWERLKGILVSIFILRKRNSFAKKKRRGCHNWVNANRDDDIFTLSSILLALCTSMPIKRGGKCEKGCCRGGREKSLSNFCQIYRIRSHHMRGDEKRVPRVEWRDVVVRKLIWTQLYILKIFSTDDLTSPHFITHYCYYYRHSLLLLCVCTQKRPETITISLFCRHNFVIYFPHANCSRFLEIGGYYL